MPLPSRPWFFALLLLLLLAVAGAASAAEEPSRAFLSARGAASLGHAQRALNGADLPGALERANQALSSDPDSGEVHAILGAIYSRMNDQNKAKKSFERAIRYSPRSGPVLNAYGAWLCEQGRVAEAEAQFLLAIADVRYQNPEQAMGNAGDCALRNKDAAKAEQFYRRGLARAPENAMLLTRMARLSYESGDLMRARAFLQRRDSAQPLDRELLELAIRIEEQAGDTIAADRYRNRLRELAPPQPPTGEGPSTP